MYRNILHVIKLQPIKLSIISVLSIAFQLPIDRFNEDILTYIGIDNFDKKWSYFLIILIALMLLVMLISSIKYYKELVILSSWKTKILTQNEIKELKITKKISVIGLSNSGKTTFINRITHKNPSNVKTQKIEGKILCIDRKMLCFIDISGENLAEQMRAIELADFIILFIDHSESSESMIINQKRIIETRNLLKRIKEHLEVGNQKIIPSIVLMNKKDLWAKTKSKEEDLISKYSDISKELGEIFQKDSKLYHYSNFTNKKVKSEELRNIVDYILEKLGV